SEAASPYAGRRFAVRVAPELLGGVGDGALAETLAASTSGDWRDVRDALLGLALPDAVERDLELLGNERPRVNVYLDAHGRDYQSRARGVVCHARYGIRGRGETGEGDVASTEDDVSGSRPGRAVALDGHCAEVAKKVRRFADACGLPIDRVNELGV